MNVTDPLSADWGHTSSYIPPESLLPSTVTYPFYFAARDSLIPGLSDKYLSLLTPTVVYWLVSLFFEIADRLNSPYFEPYRLHTPEELTKRNKVTKWECFRAVVVQQVIQTALGFAVLEDDPEEWGWRRDHMLAMSKYVPWVMKAARALLGQEWGNWALRRWGSGIVEWCYWWGMPLAQFFFSTLVLDAWQYFFHRLFHTSTFLYKHVHSWHHRLYVPYSYGALYNHPLEGFIFDSAGGLVSTLCSLMTIRQATLFFGIACAKTVDDHCGFALPWDPMQIFFANTAETHDVHHQIFGLKKNFSQPFYLNWDWVCGTYLDPREVKNGRWRGKAVTDRRDPKVQETLTEEEKKKLL